MIDPKMLYEGLPKEFATTYRNAASEEYGEDIVLRSETELSKLGKEGFELLKKEAEEVTTKLFEQRFEDPKSDGVQSLIANHYRIIRKFWGTYSLPDKQADAYAGLGQLYVNDERFTILGGVPQPQFAQFLQKAMKFYSQQDLQ